MFFPLKNKKAKDYAGVGIDAGADISVGRGFTLIEMLVSVAIIAVIASVVVYNHGKFNSDLELSNAAYRLALSIRQAQVYGISARQVAGAREGKSFNLPYGVHLNNPFAQGYNDRYIFFADANDSRQKYTTTGNDDMACAAIDEDTNECIEQTILGRGIRISGFYASDGGDWHNLSDDFNDLHSVDIVFIRPNPDAIFNFSRNNYSGTGEGITSNRCGGPDDCQGVAICLISPQDRKKRVVVLSTGQISVENVNESIEDDICSNPTDSGGNGGGNDNGNNNNNQGNQGFDDE